jgi:hypothetical protein
LLKDGEQLLLVDWAGLEHATELHGGFGWCVYASSWGSVAGILEAFL